MNEPQKRSRLKPPPKAELFGEPLSETTQRSGQRGFTPHHVAVRYAERGWVLPNGKKAESRKDWESAVCHYSGPFTIDKNL